MAYWLKVIFRPGDEILNIIYLNFQDLTNSRKDDKAVIDYVDQIDTGHGKTLNQ